MDTYTTYTTVTVELTPEEYEYLYVNAPEGIQAAMDATAVTRVFEEPEPKLLRSHQHKRNVP